MAFTIETGTGVEYANAFVSVAELDEYADDRAKDISSFSDAQKQAAIISASTDYINTFFTFPGVALEDDQGMQIPTDEVALNADIKRACCMSALLSLGGRLFVDPTDIQTKLVTSESSKIGSLSDSTTYNEDGAGYTTKYPTTAIDMILNKYTVSAAGLGQLVRGG